MTRKRSSPQRGFRRVDLRGRNDVGRLSKAGIPQRNHLTVLLAGASSDPSERRRPGGDLTIFSLPRLSGR